MITLELLVRINILSEENHRKQSTFVLPVELWHLTIVRKPMRHTSVQNSKQYTVLTRTFLPAHPYYCEPRSLSLLLFRCCTFRALSLSLCCVMYMYRSTNPLSLALRLGQVKCRVSIEFYLILSIRMFLA